MNECAICFCDYPDDQCYTLPNCLHKFCKTCLAAQFEQKIKDLQIELSDFKCPTCDRVFSPDILEYFLSKPLYNKYCEYAFQYNKIMGLEDYEILTNCLNKQCPEKYVIWKDAEYATCPKCKKKFCRKCQLEYHQDKGITCEQQKELHKDDEYLEMKRTLKLCKCPKCKNVFQKTTGCNHMACKCKAHFCFLCDKEFDYADRYKHFQNNDPYKSPCRVWQDGAWVDPKNVKPKGGQEKLIQDQPADNPVPCPNCKSYNNTITKLIISYQYVLCNSVKCKGLIFCLNCNRGIQAQNLPDHFVNGSTLCKFK